MKNYEQMHFIKVGDKNGWLFRNTFDKNLFKFRGEEIKASSCKGAIEKLRAKENPEQK